MIRHHNQPDRLQSGRGGARAEARGGGKRVGGTRPIVWTLESIDKKIPKKIHFGLRWLLIGNFICNNEPRTCGNGMEGNG